MKQLKLFFLSILGFPALGQTYVDGEVYMKTVDTFSTDITTSYPAMVSLVSTYQIDTIYYPFKGLGNDTLDHTCRIRFSNYALANQLINDLKLMPVCHYAEKAVMYSTSFTPNDLTSNQWNLQKIQATGAWNVSKGSASKVIAIVDNGVLITHEDLAPNLWVNSGEIAGNGFDDDLNGYTDDKNGYDVADRDANPNPPAGISGSDAFNHGTHCAGIASAATNNGKGIASIGYSIKIMSIKCTRNSDTGDQLSATLDGITYAIRNNANVISMSFGSKDNSSTFDALLNTAKSRGIVCVAAAGNEDSTTPFYPASSPAVISVGATDQNDVKASFSNYGSTLDLMAPGVGIFSCLGSGNSDYAALSGTSMAAPLVAGLAGLILSANPGFTPAQVESNLKASADNINALNPSVSGQLGAGRINAKRSLGDTSPNDVDMLTDNKIGAYPNPFVDYIQLDNEETLRISISDLNGRVLYSGNDKRIDTHALVSGLYIFSIQSKEGNIKSLQLAKL